MTEPSGLSMNSYTTVFIGTSPLVLSHALFARMRGDQVAILESSKDPGGAWRTTEAFGYSNIEAAVHLIENRPRVYSVLSGMGVPLFPAHGSCFAISRHLRTGLHIGRMASYAGVAARAIAKGRFDRARTALGCLVQAWRDRLIQFQYPPKGASQITATLLDALADLGVRPQFGVSAITATHADGIGGGGFHHLQTTGGIILFQRLCLSSRANCSLIRNGRQILPASSVSQRQCLVLLVGMIPGPYGYAEVAMDSLIRRMRDLTGMVSPMPPPGQRILSVELRSALGAERALVQLAAEQAMMRLKRYGFAPVDARVLDVHQESFTTKTIPDRYMRYLERTQGDWLVAIRSTDFAEELASNLASLNLNSPWLKSGPLLKTIEGGNVSP